MKMLDHGCPSDAELSRAFTVGAEPAVEAHVAGCPRCHAAWRGFEELRLVARELPAPRLSEASRERARRALLTRGASLGQRRRWPWPTALTIAAGAAAALVIIVLQGPLAEHRLARARGEAPPRNGQVTAVGAARFQFVSERPDEVVRLEEGTISVEVNKLPPGERFRVRTGDGEVEVRGTAFEVSADGDRLAAVRVHHGRVEVRAPAGPARPLGAGESWSAPARAAVTATVEPPRPEPRPARVPVARPPRRSPVASAPRPAPARVASVQAGPPPRPTSPAEDHFREAWAALRAGDAASAQAELDQAEASAGAASIIEDIRFWRGVVLQRRGRPQEARRAFEEFLARHPDSARAGEASVALGWSLLAAEQREAARVRFEVGARDRSARVRESARAGLAAAANHEGGVNSLRDR